jgi:hypothetical protein
MTNYKTSIELLKEKPQTPKQHKKTTQENNTTINKKTIII